MARYVPNWVQYTVLIALLGICLTVYYKQDEVSKLIFKTDQTGKGKKASRKNRRNRQAPVIVTNVFTTQNDQIIEAIGDGRAKRFITLYSEAPGEIISLPVKAGEQIKKDQIILELNSQKEKLAVKVAQTKLTEAQRKMERTEQLRKQNVTSKANVDDAQTQLNRAELELLQAKENLNDHFLKAPFDGILGIPKVELGDRIATNTEIITLDDRTALSVEFDVPEQYHSQIKAGQKIKALTPGFSGQEFEGFIKEIDSRIDTSSRSFKVRAEIPNQKDLLRPGMSFAVKMILKGQTYPTVPELAFQWGKKGSFVWRVNNGKAEQILVQLVRRLDSNILVKGPIKEGDLIVVEGVQRLRPNIKVKYKEPKSSNKNGRPSS